MFSGAKIQVKSNLNPSFSIHSFKVPFLARLKRAKTLNLLRPSTRQSVSEIDFLTVAAIFNFLISLLTFTLKSENLKRKLPNI